MPTGWRKTKSRRDDKSPGETDRANLRLHAGRLLKPDAAYRLSEMISAKQKITPNTASTHTACLEGITEFEIRTKERGLWKVFGILS